MKDHHEINGQLCNQWNRQLYRWWHSYNQEYLSEALQRPLIRLGKGAQPLGSWHPERRILTISQVHIMRDPWTSVMHTLRHEMAHQYADEVLKPIDEGPHGPAFQKACQRLRCLPGSETRPGKPCLPEEEKIFRILKKVLSLASSPNEHEAQAAVQKARYLLTKYSVDLVEFDRERNFSFRCLGTVKGRRMSYELWLASILNQFFFVEVLWAESYDALRGRSGSVLEIFGTATNLDMAEYVYHYLLTLLDHLWKKYKTLNGISINRERQRYFAGVLEGFYRKLHDQEASLEKTHALVWKGDPRLQKFFRYLNPRVQRRSWGGPSRNQTYEDGRLEGKRVTIQRPIAEKGTGLAGYLNS
ncbi:MAG: DUF2786 domain-containing protein [Acidobacteriota bacterium]